MILHFLQNQCDPLAHADAHRAEGVTSRDALPLNNSGDEQSHPTGPKWVADGDRASVRIDLCSIVCQSQQKVTSNTSSRKRFIQSDHIHLPELQPDSPENLSAHRKSKTIPSRSSVRLQKWQLPALERAESIDAGPRRAFAIFGRNDFFPAPSFTPEALPAVTVPSALTMVCNFANASSVVSGLGGSSVVMFFGTPASVRPPRGHLPIKESGCVRGRPALLASAGDRISIFATDRNPREILRGLRHGVDSKLFLHPSIHETPAEGGIIELGASTKRGVRFREDQGRTRHTSTPPAIIKSASPHLMALAAVATASKLEPQSRLMVVPVTCSGNPANKRAILPNVAVILASSIGAPVDHVIHRPPV